MVNPGSRSGAQAIGLAGARLSSAGFDLVLSAPCSRHEVGPWIEAHAEGAQAIVVAGGDGSLNAVAEAVVKTKLPLGIIPAGTANDLARSLGLPTDMELAADVIAAGHRKQIDVGDVNGHKFFNVASVGLSADLARELSGEIKRKFGRLGYALTAAKVLGRARPFRASIVSEDGTVRVRTMQIAVGNGRYYGGGLAVEQTAEIDDGQLDLFPARSAWPVARGPVCQRLVVRSADPQAAPGQRRRRTGDLHAGAVFAAPQSGDGIRSGTGSRLSTGSV